MNPPGDRPHHAGHDPQAGNRRTSNRTFGPLVGSATATMPNALLVSPGTGHWTLNNATDPGCLLAATTAFIQAG